MTIGTDATAHAAPSRFGLNGAHVAFATVVFFVGYGATSLRNFATWYFWGAVVLAIFVGTIVWIVRSGSLKNLRKLPLPLLIFAGWALLSTLWSQWAPTTLLGFGAFILAIVIAIPLALFVGWDELLVGFSGGLRWVIGLSFVFELFVSLVIRHPILPAFITDVTWQDASLQLLWSRNTLFVDGKIQGIVGNSSILAGVAAVALIVVGIQIAARRMGKRWGAFWIALIILTLILTRSATMTIALVVTGVVLVVILIRRRLTSFVSRLGLYGGLLVVVAVAAITISTNWAKVAGLFGKSPDLTGRFEIWQGVIAMATERPIVGWGWLGYWAPWIPELHKPQFERNGVAQLHAHNAWLDLWMQVGIIGLLIFAALVITALVRAYRASVTPVWDATAGSERQLAITLLPILVLTLLVVQSFTESRILNEEGLITLALFAIKLKIQPLTRFSTGAAQRP
jgi:O-antigen ligase